MTGRQPPDPMLLVFLLIATGIGSFLWHGFRTRTGLLFDALPGILFLLVFVFLWLRALFGPLAGALASISVPAASFGVMAWGRPYLAAYLPMRPSPLALVPLFGVILALGIGFVVLTWKRRGASFGIAAMTALAFGTGAAFFRSIDLESCAAVPFGTHFLWHVLLSTAAYCCIALVTRLKAAELLPRHGQAVLQDAG
jgi:hypothetical protein